MKLQAILILFGSIAISLIGCGQENQHVWIESAEEFQNILDSSNTDLTIRLKAGDYFLQSTTILDSTCGNCEDPETEIPASAGVILSGRNIFLVGPEDHSAVVHTQAGYGFYFRGCDNCGIENITVTGGTRDMDSRATDAGIVVKNSRVTIKNCVIMENIGEPQIVDSTIVGIIGIAGREGSHIRIVDNAILRNSWDGIALYRGAQAEISGNRIDGVDKAVGSDIGGGRGVAIGVTWDARANIRENWLRRYWKGIGIFVDARVTVQRNIVEDMVTWGISYWDAGKGEPVGVIHHNIIYNTGACGAAIIRDTPGVDTGFFTHNTLIHTAQNPKYDDPDYYCYQCALAIHEKPEDFVIARNLFYDNRRATDSLPDWNMPDSMFYPALDSLCTAMENPYWEQTDVYKKYCLEED